MHRIDIHPSHRGAMEDQGPGRDGCGCLSFQDTNSQQGDVTSHGEHEGWVPSQNAFIRIGRAILCLRTDQKFLPE